LVFHTVITDSFLRQKKKLLLAKTNAAVSQLHFLSREETVPYSSENTSLFN